jgi:hypothetical protein
MNTYSEYGQCVPHTAKPAVHRQNLHAMTDTRKTSTTLPDIRFDFGALSSTAREHEAMPSLIRRLAVSAGIGTSERPLGAATLEALTGGRSEARVFKLTPFFGPGRAIKGAPVVMKIAPDLQCVREKANYDACVRHTLPAASRPELLGFVRTRTHSGLCYSFVGRADGVRGDTLTDCLQRGDLAKLDLVLRSLIKPMRNTWHAAALLRMERDIAKRYLDRYFTGPRSTAQTESTLQACAVRYFGAQQKAGRCVIGELSFPSPRTILFASRRKRPYRSCIIHGDLNSDNLIFTGGRSGVANVAMIDFQKTGRGHVHEDLIALEASVRINFPQDTGCSDILEQERLIALGRGSRKDPYTASIRKIRDSATRHFGQVEDAANYHFAVAAIGLRLMQATDLVHVARARITASTLWAAKVLAGEKI